MTDDKQVAKDYFYKKDYSSALKIFIQRNDFYEAGLCSLLLKNEHDAKKYWELGKKNSPACQWGLSVLKFINLKTASPSFFQTRAFLEVYLNLFLENNLIEWAQNLVSCCDVLYQSNPESYKFIARALFSNGYFSLAITFCKKSLKLFYSDPEAFLILAQCQFLINNLGDSLDSINRIINMVDDYYPALLFRKVVQDEIIKRKRR